MGSGGEARIGAMAYAPARGVLRAPGGAEHALRPKTQRLLDLLLAEAGRVVPRERILDTVWGEVHVTDDSITQCVVELRRALGPEAARLRTLPRRGYLLDLPAAPQAPPVGPSAPRAEPGLPVVAVLPLRLVAPEPGLAAFADVLLEGIVGALALGREPVVISASSTRRFAGAVEDPAGIAARLGAGYLASGTLRRAGEGLRLSVELAEAASGAVLWRRSYDLPEAVSLETEDRIAANIAHTLAPQVQSAELRRALRQAPADLGAYHLLLEARRLIYRLDPAPFAEAGRLLGEALARDPSLAAAEATRADWHSLRVWQGWSPDPDADIASLERAAERAIALDPAQARALALLGHNQVILHRRFDAARALFDRALEAAPNDAEAWMWSAPCFAYLGEAEEALARARRAMALSPEDPLAFRFQHFLSIAHYAARDWAAAAEWGLASRAANPRYTSNLRTTAAALAALGRTEEAQRLADEVLALEPGFRVAPFLGRLPHRDPAVVQRYGAQLLAAGLPE